MDTKAESDVVVEDDEIPVDDEQDNPADVEGEGDGEADDPGAAAQSDDEEGEQEGDGGAESTEGGGSAYDKLLAKYGGDTEKMAKSVFESYNSAARLHDRLQTIEKFILGQQQQPAPVDEEKIVRENPEIQRLLQQLKGTQERIASLERDNAADATEYGKLVREAKYLEGQVSKADLEDKGDLQRKLDRVESKQEALEDKIKGRKDRIEELKERERDISQRGQETEQKVREGVKRLRQQAQNDIRNAQAARGQFSDAVIREAARYGITDQESPKFKLLMRAVRNDVKDYLSSLPKDAPPIDLNKAVNHYLSQYAKEMGLKPRVAAKGGSSQTGATTTPMRGATSTTPADGGKPPKDGQWTKAYVDARAKRLLGG